MNRIALCVALAACAAQPAQFSEGPRVLVPAARAEQPPACVKRSELRDHLAQKFAEYQRVLGLDDSGNALEVFASIGGETWTAFITMPNGTSCLLDTGHDLFIVPTTPGRGS